MSIERRFFVDSVEMRGKVGQGAVIRGHAAVFNQVTRIHDHYLGEYDEQVGARAFTKTINEGDIRALFNHDSNFPLGRNRAGTLRLAVDSVGLDYEIDMPTNPMAQMVAEAIERGDVTGSSFAFYTIRDEWEKRDDQVPLRTLTEVSLDDGDVSPVTYPAYSQTDVDVARAIRSMSRDFGIKEDELKEAIEAGDLRRALVCEEAEATTETPVDAPPEQAPVATSPPEPEPLKGTPLYVFKADVLGKFLHLS